MKQPYIYTLPEAFIEDKSVPMRWKLYALINGFWIAGLDVFASNKFFAEKLKCSERHIQGCLEDLEKLGTIRREVHGMDRKIYPGTNPAFVGGRTGGSQRHEPSVRHNSDSISERLNTESEDALRIVEVVEVEEHKQKSTKEPLLEKSAKYWHSLCKKEVGREPTGGLVKTQGVIKNARKSLEFSQIKHMMDSWFENETLQEHEMIQITRCLSNFQIDKYLAENA